MIIPFNDIRWFRSRLCQQGMAFASQILKFLDCIETCHLYIPFFLIINLSQTAYTEFCRPGGAYTEKMLLFMSTTNVKMWQVSSPHRGSI